MTPKLFASAFPSCRLLAHGLGAPTTSPFGIRPLLVGFALTLAGCSGGGGSGGGSGSNAILPPFLVLIDAGASAGTPGEVINLQARAVQNELPIAAWEWSMEGSVLGIADTVQVQLGVPGTHVILAKATDSHGRTVETATALSSHDVANPVNPFGQPLPQLRGDVNLDGLLTTVDERALGEYLAGVTPLLSPNAYDSADFNLDGLVDFDDLALVASAVQAPQHRLEMIYPPEGPPGRAVTVFSPALDVPSGRFEIAFGQVAPRDFARPILGQARLVVPVELGGALSSRDGALVSTAIPVRILRDGVEVASIPFTLAAPVPVEDPVQLLGDLCDLQLDILDHAHQQFEAALRGSIGQAEQLSEAHIEVLTAWVAVARDQLRTVTARQSVFLGMLDAEQRVQVGLILGANEVLPRLTQIRDELGSSQSRGLGGGPVSSYAQLCQFTRIVQAWHEASQLGGMTCLAFSTLALVPPLTTLAPELALTCLEGLAYAGIVNIAAAFIPQLQSRIELQLSHQQPLSSDDSVDIRPYIPIQSFGQMACSGGGAAGGLLLEHRLQDLISSFVLNACSNNGWTGALMRATQLVLPQFVQLVTNVVSSTLHAVGVAHIIQDAANFVCGQLDIGTALARIEIDSFHIFDPPDPFVGALSAPAQPGTGQPATYSYHDNPAVPVPPEGVRLSARTQGCTGLISGEVFVACVQSNCGSTCGPDLLWVATAFGDCNMDGRLDFVTTSIRDDQIGAVDVEVRTCGERRVWIRSFQHNNPFQGFNRATGIGDVDHDGRADIAYLGNGVLWILSGLDGSDIAVRWQAYYLPWAVPIGDADLDGYPEFGVVTGPSSTIIMSSAGGFPLSTVPIDLTHRGILGGFTYVRLAGDLDIDGVREICVTGGTFYSGSTGMPVNFPVAPQPNCDFTWLQMHAPVVDISGDGIDDAVGFTSIHPLHSTKVIGAVSGQDGNFLWVLPLQSGSMVEYIGDYNGDSFADVIVGDPVVQTMWEVRSSNTGVVVAVLPFFTGAELLTLDQYGDISGDGLPEYGAPLATWNSAAQAKCVKFVSGGN